VGRRERRRTVSSRENRSVEGCSFYCTTTGRTPCGSRQGWNDHAIALRGGGVKCCRVWKLASTGEEELRVDEKDANLRMLPPAPKARRCCSSILQQQALLRGAVAAPNGATAAQISHWLASSGRRPGPPPRRGSDPSSLSLWRRLLSLLWRHFFPRQELQLRWMGLWMSCPP
jgi:hypothetical protein